MFVKYNGVLRGLQSESAFLRNQMLQLCGATGIADDYQRGKISFEQAKASLNKYTTTLHGINSAVIKLGSAPLLSGPSAACLHDLNASPIVCLGAES